MSLPRNRIFYANSSDMRTYVNIYNVYEYE